MQPRMGDGGKMKPMENFRKKKNFVSPVMANADILFLSTLGKPETQTLRESVIGNFSLQSILKKWQPFFNFFIMANADIPFSVKHSENQRPQLWGSQYLEIFLYDRY